MHAFIFSLLSFSFLTVGINAEKQPVYTGKNSFKKQSNIAIVTYFAPGTQYESILEPIVIENKRTYAKTNGYDFINVFDHEDLILDYKEHGNIHFFKASHYYKLRLIPLLLRKYEYQWIMWSDGDAIFLNHSLKLEPHLDNNYDLIFTSNSPNAQKWSQIINTGHFFVKNSPWSIKFMYQAYGLSFANCFEYLEGKAPINGWLNMCESREKFLLADQRILQYYVSYTPRNVYGCHFKHLPFHKFNSEFPWYQEGDLVVHFPGRPVDDKAKLIKLMIQSCHYGNGSIDYKKAPQLQPDKRARRVGDEEFDAMNQVCQ